MKSSSVFVSEDTLTFVGEGGIVFIALRNQPDKERVRIKEQTVIGKAMLTTFVLNPVPMQSVCEASKLTKEFVNRIHKDIGLDTSSEYNSFAQNFLPSTEPSEIGLLENEKKKCTNPQLLKKILGPELSSVHSSWGEEARNNIEVILTEYEDLFMKNKSDRQV